MSGETIPSEAARLEGKYRINERSISKLGGPNIATLDEDYLSVYTDQMNHAEYAKVAYHGY
ncbi:hypothetical protein HB852_00745 [Listeria grandensis]|uniref:Uncharacterized protein n=1 Tax=Listeria grandensis TaxID=1494963 RepID=A0A7X0Y144_9LIST|nr:hypothetical protein [Listeria grandensis]MBC1473144.1 hypothetical protein [Listeria grandensis]MBC1935090.1 hypothetical protein [Listeria grandensis]